MGAHTINMLVESSNVLDNNFKLKDKRAPTGLFTRDFNLCGDKYLCEVLLLQ